jgi:DNA invertase Pin-like site-specific DNA recombinase
MSQLPVAGYYRVSQARDGMRAPEIYEDEIRRYCTFKGLHLRELFSDIDFSGYKHSEKRPALGELVDRRAEFSAVIVPKLSRFGRSLKHLIQLFDVFDRDGISLVFLDMNIDTATSQGRLLRHIMAAFAEYESDVKADYARANYRHAMLNGRTWGKPPFGYVAEDKCYFVDDSKADVVRHVYARYLAGATLTSIAAELNIAGPHRRALWGPAGIGRILDNPAYAGLTSLDGELFPAQWEPIIARATWDSVQHQRLPGNRGHRVRKVGTGGPYLLSGLIFCGSCGAPAHHHNSPRSPKYRCMRVHLGAGCKGGGVTRDRADRIVTEQVLSRVRFTVGAAEFASSGDAWEAATLQERRKVLAAVIERVVIEPKEPGEGVTSPRRLHVEWKRGYSTELIVTPFEHVAPPQASGVKQGRPESHRAGRAAKRSHDQGAKVRAYYDDWAERRKRLIPDLSRRS